MRVFLDLCLVFLQFQVSWWLHLHNLLLIADYVDEATKRLGIEEKPDKDPGRPSYPPDDVAKAVLMQQYFCYANRQSEGLVVLFNEKMRIKTLFSYKTIERGYQDPFVTLILT